MRRLMIICTIVLMSCTLHADSFINYQGKLTRQRNLVNGPVDMAFYVYTNATSGDYIYMESNTVTVADGFYSYRIGKKPSFGQLRKALKHRRLFIQVKVNGVVLWPRDRYSPPPFAAESQTTWSKFSAMGKDEKLSSSMYELSTQSNSNLWERLVNGGVYASYGEMKLESGSQGVWCGMLFEPVADETHVNSVRLFSQRIEPSAIYGTNVYVQLRVRDAVSDSLVRTLSEPIKIVDNMTAGAWFEIPLNKEYENALIETDQYLDVSFYATEDWQWLRLYRTFIRVVVQ